MSKVIGLLKGFARIWTGLVVTLIALSAFTLLIRHGWTAFEETFSPFNVWNTAMVLLALFPAYLADACARKLEARLPLTLETADRLVREYRSVLERACSVTSATRD